MKFNKLTSRALALAIGTSMVFSQPAFAQTTQVAEVVENTTELTQTQGEIQETTETEETVSGNLMEDEQADENQDAQVEAPAQVTEEAAPVQEDVQATETVETEETEDLFEEVEDNEEVAQEVENVELDQAGAADEEATFIIRDAEDLNSFAVKVNGGNSYKGSLIKLANDIEFDEGNPDHFVQIGYFEGTFDGCGYTISGINYIKSSGGYPGLFREIGSSGVVKNLVLDECKFVGQYFAGSITAFNSGLIDNCYVQDVEVRGGSTSNWSIIDGSVTYESAGGIAGYSAGSILNCCFAGTVSSPRNYVGGIAGIAKGKIANCCNLGTVQGTYGEKDPIQYVGGIVAESTPYRILNIRNCYNAGELMVNSSVSKCAEIAVHIDSQSQVANSYGRKGTSDNPKYNFIKVDSADSEFKNDSLTYEYMTSQDFVNQLNKNISTNTDWLQWEFRPEESPYPVTVKRVNMSDCTITMAAKQVEYNGAAQTPQVTVSYEGKNLVPNKDYTLTYQNNKNVGTATVVIKGLGRFIDSTTANFTITSKNIAKTNIAVNSAGCVYTGYAITPAVVVKDGNVTLQPNKDYVLGYYNHVNVGTATVVVAGKGNYTGSVNKSFTISKADQKIVVSSYYQIAYGTAPTQLYINRTSGDGQITYSSSDSKIVSIDSTGKMTFKKIGSAVIAVNVAETANCKAQTLYVTVNIIPKRATVSSVKAKGKTLTVKWKKDKSASGYIVQYSTSKNFKKGVKTVTISKNKTVSKKIKGLKANKKYYVRVCSYKKVSGQKVQGAYSVVKSVKTKK